jgi:mannosyl-3-phosphoglycerate phosphatase family protein
MISFPVPKDQPLVVFTDLDGTLIDHHNYSIEGSREAIRKLADREATLVFCSSKTFAEQVYLQQQIGIDQPFIFENGSAIAIPVGFFPTKKYSALPTEQGYELVIFAHADAAALQSILRPFKTIKGYANATDVELSAATSLSGGGIQRARERGFTETLLTPLTEIQASQIASQLKPFGFTLSRGGRFYTVQSDSVSKGKAVQWMMEIFREETVQSPYFAAMGDSPNDVSMLEVVELPFLVQKPDHTWADVEIPQLIKVEGVGPAGFSAAVQMLLGE